ncbi:MAG: ABC-type multidrug transport system, ATPase and permease component [uncultured Sulfurovum sp.]|uniref:ABC-type multidrug transport system, ATPase and permease component n=1 Tax=uncultured Sulfurovum sp. TaxID=269237 RepID=A0A6S6RYV0_9BACT|nr:MAG: ABC-type multidrug transport system, ATPase and permease component [uncultured Sulfurovum sp.]
MLKANILAILSIVGWVPIPLFIPYLVDEIILKKEGFFIPFLNHFIVFESKEYYFLLVFLLIIILRAVTTWFTIIRRVLAKEITEDIRFNLRKRLLSHLKEVSMSEYDRLGSGAVSSKMMTDIDSVMKFLSGSIGNIAVQVFTLIGIAVVLLYLDWKLALIILILNPLVIRVFIQVFKKVSKLMKERNKAIGNFMNSLSESLELFGQIKVQNREGNFTKSVYEDAWEIREKSYLLELNSSKSINQSRLFIDYSNDLFKIIALYLVFLGEMSIGEMLAIFVYAGMIIPPIHMIIGFVQDYHDAKEGMDRLNDILRLKKEPNYVMKINPFEGKETVSIELKGVHFSYDENREILKDFSLKIEAGEKVAIVGETGSGKSTLANILMGLYPISQGQILYNGSEIKEIGYAVVRENIGFVLQAPLMFNASLRYNLSLGKAYSDEAMFEALKIAQLYDFVDGLEEKLDTIVGKNGTKLSGGQRQRLSIARVLLDQPKVIIFDESTSSLDMNTEDKLLEALDEYIKNKTVITIAHRQSTIDKAQRVIMLYPQNKKQER